MAWNVVSAASRAGFGLAIALAPSVGAAQNQLELGYYVLNSTPCGAASNVDLSLVHWSGINAARTVCEFTSVTPVGPESYDFVQSCQEIGLESAQDLQGRITIASPQQFELFVESGTFSYRYCPQDALPEPWRSVDITDIAR